MFLTESKTRKPALVDQDAIAYILMKNGNRSTYEGDELSLDDLSLVDKLRYAWIDYYKELRGRGYGVYHLTITYNKLSSRALRKAEVVNLFEEFYVRYFLKTVVGNNYTRPSKEKKQPITVAFVDEHESIAKGQLIDKFADRYHIHAVVAAHPDTIEVFEALLGDDTLKNPDSIHCGLIRTTHLNHAVEYCPAYASKKKFHYDDFLIFGPKKLDA